MNVRTAVSVADGLMRQSFYYHLQRLTIQRPGTRERSAPFAAGAESLLLRFMQDGNPKGYML